MAGGLGDFEVYSVRPWRPSSIAEALSGLAGRRWAAFYGEVHERRWSVAAALATAGAASRLGAAWLGLEHFNYEQQQLLDAWLEGRIDWGRLVEAYSGSREGFRLEAYRPLLEGAARLGLRIVALMPPRELAALVARRGLGALEGVEGLPVSPGEVRLDYPGYRERFLELIPRHGPMARLDPERLLEAQAFKDQVMAALAARALERLGPGLVVAGWAHVEHRGTVPERLSRLAPGVAVRVVTSREAGPEEARGELEALASRGLLLAGHAVLPGRG